VSGLEAPRFSWRVEIACSATIRAADVQAAMEAMTTWAGVAAACAAADPDVFLRGPHFGHLSVERDGAKWPTSGGRPPQVSRDRLTDVAVAYLRAGPRRKVRAVADALGVRQSMANIYIRRAREAGLLPRTSRRAAPESGE
jgi:hypothetical protein